MSVVGKLPGSMMSSLSQGARDPARFHNIHVNGQWHLIFRCDEGVHGVPLTDCLMGKSSVSRKSYSHPGEMLLDEFLVPMDVSLVAFAECIGGADPAWLSDCTLQAWGRPRNRLNFCAGTWGVAEFRLNRQ